MRILIFLCVLSLVFSSTSQNLREPVSTGKINKKRFIISNSSIGLLSSASLIGLHRLWYSKESQEAFHLFENLLDKLKLEFVTILMNLKLVRPSIEKKAQLEKKEIKKSFDKKISRNEPCPCGSGKKYKRCCGAL